MNLINWCRKHREYRFILYALPILIVWFVLSIYPHLEVIPLSLYKWSPLSKTRKFVGLYYFKMIFTHQWKESSGYMVNTVLYIFYLFGIQTVLALLLALILQKNSMHNKFFRALFFLPMVFSSTMVSLTWSYMYDPNLGIINNILGMLKVEGFPGHSFFTPDWCALLFIVLVHIWHNIGYPITIYTSGLQTISEDVNEAATLDGVNPWSRFWKVTFPLMLPTILRTTMLTFTTGALAYDYILMMGSRMTTVSYDTWATIIYKGMGDNDYGMVSAKSVLLFVILTIMVIAQYIATKKAEDACLG